MCPIVTHVDNVAAEYGLTDLYRWIVFTLIKDESIYKPRTDYAENLRERRARQRKKKSSVYGLPLCAHRIYRLLGNTINLWNIQTTKYFTQFFLLLLYIFLHANERQEAHKICNLSAKRSTTIVIQWMFVDPVSPFTSIRLWCWAHETTKLNIPNAIQKNATCDAMIWRKM